jgi:hypothetical protein
MLSGTRQMWVLLSLNLPVQTIKVISLRCTTGHNCQPIAPIIEVVTVKVCLYLLISSVKPKIFFYSIVSLLISDIVSIGHLIVSHCWFWNHLRLVVSSLVEKLVSYPGKPIMVINLQDMTKTCYGRLKVMLSHENNSNVGRYGTLFSQNLWQ